MELDWITPEEAGKHWGIKARQVQALCGMGQVSGAIKLGRVWLIPRGTPKPLDGRTQAAKSAKAAALDAERIIGEVNGTMSIEGMTLTDEDKARLRVILSGEVSADEMVRQLVAKHRRAVDVGRVRV